MTTSHDSLWNIIDRRTEQQAEFNVLSAQRDKLLIALQATIQPLILLGDFIGNRHVGKVGIPPFDRCAVLAQVRAAIERAHNT